MIKPRWYQDAAIDSSLKYLDDPKKTNGVVIAPTGSGKSVIIANIAKEINTPKLILQPSKEILEQNYEKYTSYGFPATKYSASVRQKEISDTTFATIKSVINKIDDFKHFKHLFVDECHLVDPKGGMYNTLIETLSPRILGFTASPFRLSTDRYGGSMLKFITRTNPRVFKDIVYCIQSKPLFDQGFLSPMKYFPVPGFEQFRILGNSTGAGYDERALKAYYKKIEFLPKLLKCVRRLAEIGRKNILIFTEFIEEAEFVADSMPGMVRILTGKTPDKERIEITKLFKAGLLWGVITVGVWVVGFDYDRLETVVLASPMLSMAQYYQKIGRVTRPHPEKEYGMVVDMCDNMRLFGKIEDLEFKNLQGKWSIWNQEKQLTNMYFNR